MTVNSAFKKQVRARMVRTGEKYTEARRALLAERVRACSTCDDDCYVDIPDEETGGVLGPGPCPHQNEPWHVREPSS